MLENIKSLIHNMPDISFDEYYVEYLMQVQDRGIDDEVEYTLKQFKNDLLNIDKVLQTEYGELVNKD